MPLGQNCSSSCETRDHATFGECMKAKNLRVAYCQDWKGDAYDYTEQKKWDKGLEEYRAARKAGIQPAATDITSVRRAVAASEETGEAFIAQ